jgi:hypothetical protein
MNMKFPKLYYYLKTKIRSRRGRDFIRNIHKVFQSPVFKTAVPLFFTTGISLEIKLIAKPLVTVVITIFMYLVYLTFSGISDTYQKRVMEKAICSKELLSQLSKVNAYIATHKLYIIKKISSPMSYIPSSEDYKSLSYQEIGFMVCQAVFYTLREALGKDAFTVTLFVRCRSKTKRVYIKMIAFANKDTTVPIGFDNEYFLDEYPICKGKKNANDFYHKEIFRKGENTIYTLCNKNEIENHFRVNNKSGSGELKTRQYIGIPVFCSGEGIVSLLQIDTDKDGLLGKSNSELQELGDYLLPLTNFLTANYNRDILIQCLLKKMNIIIRNRKKGRKNAKPGKSTEKTGTLL